MRLKNLVLNGVLGALILSAMIAPATAKQAKAELVWQKPVFTNCHMLPGTTCNVEVTCPKSHPQIISGGGGVPKAEPEQNKMVMTMSLPIASDKWRVRWRNLSELDDVKAKTVVKILCTSK